MMMVTLTFDELGKTPSAEELLELEKAAKMPYVMDDDCPLMTKAQLMQFKRFPDWTPDAATNTFDATT